MPQSLSRLYVHLVFSTKLRVPNLVPDVRQKLSPYMGGVLKNVGCDPIQIGGVADHIHILTQMPRTSAVAQLVEKAKTSTSKWLKGDISDFAWQTGYGAFSLSKNELDPVIQYIRNQEEHHKTRTFQDEYRAMLRELEIEFDERFVWD